MTIDAPNNLELDKAQALVERIKAKWRERGYAANAWLVPGQFVNAWRCRPHFVRSNLVNGLPPPSARIEQGSSQ